MQTAQLKTAKPDRTPLIYDLLDVLAEEIPIVLLPSQTTAERERALLKARAKRHWRGLRNLALRFNCAVNGGGWNNIGKAPEVIKYPQYDTAFVGGKFLVLGVRPGATA